MRHVWSFLLSLVLTPLIYISAGFSAVKLGEANELDLAAILGLIAALVAGGLYALLVMARLSPVGPVFAGLVYLGVTIWALVARDSFLSTIPADLAGQQELLHVPVGFGTALLAAPLLFTVFSPRRWRSSAKPTTATYEAAPAYSTAPPASAAPAYGALDTTLTSPEFTSPAYVTPAYTPPTYPTTTYEPPIYSPPSSYTPPTHPLAGPAPQPTGSEGERGLT